MEAYPGVFTSDLDAQDWEPLAEVPGSEFHALLESDDYQSRAVAHPREGNMTFRWSAPARDTFLVLEGEGRIEIDDCPTLNVKPGSMVSLPVGVEATGHVTRPYKDLYVIGLPLARSTHLSNRFERRGT